ncbi:MAG TPA: hypothetical protein VK034_19935 [Enhygromyxa sp.]|nr:hypothetical protein [Enhygromyxa sp.]
MWTEREREDLSVWADELQAQGDTLGELITTSLVLESRGSEQSEETRALRDRVFELDGQVCRPMVEDLFGGFPELEPTWEHGMVVALRVVDHPLGRRLGQRALDSLHRLLRLPVARFLRYLRVDARELDWTPIHREVPAMLVEPDVVARPWVVVLGAPPRHMRRRAPTRVIDVGGSLATLTDVRRGLRSLFLDTVRIDLPWHRGDKGTRRQAASRLVDHGPSRRLDAAPNLTRLARALWDPSLRVRLQVLDALPLLGVHAAALVPELLLVERGQFEWVTRVREVLDTLSRNPALVEAVALNFTADQTRCAGWLAASPLQVARRAAPRIQGMLFGPRPIEGWARRELEHALRGMNHRASLQREAASLDSRSPTGLPVLRRLRRWLG